MALTSCEIFTRVPNEYFVFCLVINGHKAFPWETRGVHCFDEESNTWINDIAFLCFVFVRVSWEAVVLDFSRTSNERLSLLTSERKCNITRFESLVSLNDSFFSVVYLSSICTVHFDYFSLQRWFSKTKTLSERTLSTIGKKHIAKLFKLGVINSRGFCV